MFDCFSSSELYLGLHKERALLVRLLVHTVSAVLLDVRIDDGDHLAALGGEGVLHGGGIGEERLVPGKVTLAAVSRGWVRVNRWRRVREHAISVERPTIACANKPKLFKKPNL